MKSSKSSSITNDFNESTNNGPVDETTLFLKEQAAPVPHVNSVSEAFSVTWMDEEATQCSSPLADKQPSQEIYPGVATVISILLLGAFDISLPLFSMAP